jgi:hypothetical protein
MGLLYTLITESIQLRHMCRAIPEEAVRPRLPTSNIREELRLQIHLKYPVPPGGQYYIKMS